MKTDFHESIEAPQGVTITVAKDNTVTVKGPKGEVKRQFFDPKITFTQKGNTVDFDSKQGTRKEKKRMYSYIAHINNMMKGVVTPFEYKLKVCSGHFPMNVTLSGTTLSVKNFLGEKTPRVRTFPAGATVKVEADKISVTSPDLELAGQIASSFEQLTRITNRDLRIFQDGIYIIKKPGDE